MQMLDKYFFSLNIRTIKYSNRMTSSKECGSDVSLIIYLLICTLLANGYCDNNFNKNYKETFKPRPFNSQNKLTESNRNLKENYTTSAPFEWLNVRCRCNTTKISSNSVPINGCHCMDSEIENREQVVSNNKKLKLNYSENEVNQTVYLNVNFENLNDRQRRDVIDESSTSTNGLHGEWY